MENPLITPIEHILTASPGFTWTEHALIRQLVEQGFLCADYGRESLSLFQAHFLVMNALYQLRQSFPAKGVGRLFISTLSTVFTPANSPSDTEQSGSQELTEENGKLTEYYLSWDNLTSASDDSVDQLLKSFWRRYGGQEDRQNALYLLELQEPVTMQQIKRRYREKAMSWHPDRGGSNEQLAELNNALGVLKRYYA